MRMRSLAPKTSKRGKSMSTTDQADRYISGPVAEDEKSFKRIWLFIARNATTTNHLEY